MREMKTMTVLDPQDSLCSSWGLRFTKVSASDELGDDADGDFGDGLRADIQAEGGVDAVEGFSRDASSQEVLEDQLDLTLAADHAGVAGGGSGQVEEGFFVVGVAAGDDQG